MTQCAKHHFHCCSSLISAPSEPCRRDKKGSKQDNVQAVVVVKSQGQWSKDFQNSISPPFLWPLFMQEVGWNVTLSSIFLRLPEFFSWESALTVFLSLCPLSHSAALIYLPSLSAASCCFLFIYLFFVSSAAAVAITAPPPAACQRDPSLLSRPRAVRAPVSSGHVGNQRKTSAAHANVSRFLISSAVVMFRACRRCRDWLTDSKCSLHGGGLAELNKMMTKPRPLAWFRGWRDCCF